MDCPICGTKISHRTNLKRHIIRRHDVSDLEVLGKSLLLYFEVSKGAFNNYVDRKGWIGGQSNVYAYKINDLSLFTSFV